MADPVKLEERLVSGKGVLKLPESAKKSRYLILYVDLIRAPNQRYLNFNYNPPKGRLATLVLLKNGYVQSVDEISYDRESRTYVADFSGQNLIAIKCMYDGILKTFTNLGNSLGSPTISVTDLIKDYESLHLGWDEIKVVCYAETALQLRLFGKPYDTCDPLKDKQHDPPPPPPPLPKVPPGTSIGDISQPYPDEPEGNPDTVPFPGDEAPPPPEPGTDTGDTVHGAVYSVAYSYRQFPGGSVITQGGVPVLGEVGGVRFKSPTDKTVQIYCCGRCPNVFDPPPPSPLGWYDIQQHDERSVDLTLVSVNLIHL